MKVTIVSVRAMPWEMEGRTGVSVRADAIIEMNGGARVCRLKLPRSMSQLQPGNYLVEPVPFVDEKGMLGFRLGELRPVPRAEK